MNVLWTSDNGDGTYRNPVIHCDYSDPDAICVDGVYYLTASTFNYLPGLPILTSTDLVNWTLRNYAVKRIREKRYDTPQHADGIWAPAIRYHDGRFYIFYGMPDEGIYMVTAENPLGDWDAPVLVKEAKGLIDPCPLWDDDGRAYIIHGYAKSRIGFNSRLGIFPISADGRTALADDRLLYDGTVKHPTIEGPKAYKRDGWYYIFAPAGGVATGWQVCLRSRSIYGPYEDKVVLKQGSSEINGPHQGAWVETDEGEDWFLHFQSKGLYGRVMHLQPMHWQEDGWPYIGVRDENPVPPEQIEAGINCEAAALTANAADCGIPVTEYQKPKGTEGEITGEVGDDDFRGALGLQWQFMANLQPDFYQVGDGVLKLNAKALPNGGDRLWQCPQTLTQKIACPAFFAETTMSINGLLVGEQAGIGMVGGQYAYVAVRRSENNVSLVYVASDGSDHHETVRERVTIADAPVTFRVTLLPTSDKTAVTTFEYAQGSEFKPFGQPFEPTRHTWVGARLALFAMRLSSDSADCGYAEFGAVTLKAVETL